MKMTLSTSSWKYALLTLSIIISLLDVGLISYGVVVWGGAASITGAYTVSLLGFYVFSLCFLGSCAALRESYFLSMVYVGVTAAGVITKVVYIITFATMKDEILLGTSERINRTWSNELEHPGAMKSIQMQYSCCGYDSPQDYLEDDDDVLPDSCCWFFDCTVDSKIFARGCAATALEFVDDQSVNLILTIVALIVFELISIFTAYFLGKSVENVVVKMEQIIIEE